MLGWRGRAVPGLPAVPCAGTRQTAINVHKLPLVHPVCWLQQAKEAGKDISVCVVEKGAEVGELYTFGGGSTH